MNTDTQAEARPCLSLPVRARKDGTALVEMTVGLVALLAVFAGMLFIARLGRERTQTLQEARAKAGRFAMAQTFISDNPGPDYIYDWSKGDDDRKHSADDEVIHGSASEVYGSIVGVAKPGDLRRLAPDSSLSRLSGDNFVTGLGLVHGQEKSDRIPLPPVIRHLLYDAESVRIESDAWLIWTREVY